MDAVEFVKIRRKLVERGDAQFNMYSTVPAEEIVAETVQWAKEHPVKTRQSEFLEHYPDARIDQNTGVLDICPNKIFGGATGINCNVQPCFECEKRFWLAEAET